MAIRVVEICRFDDITVQEGFCPGGGGGSTATFVDQSDGPSQTTEIQSEDAGGDAGASQSDNQGGDGVPTIGSLLGRSGGPGDDSGVDDSGVAGFSSGDPPNNDEEIDLDDGDNDRAHLPPSPTQQLPDTSTYMQLLGVGCCSLRSNVPVLNAWHQYDGRRCLTTRAPILLFVVPCLNVSKCVHAFDQYNKSANTRHALPLADRF